MSRVLDLLTPAHGQCRLDYVSATQLKLTPYNGRLLSINGQPELIPTAGVTVANTGLSASTFYYVYAYMNGSTMTLELSTTGHTASNGVECKTGDASRTLVGACITNASSQFVDSTTVIGVISWFNRRRRVAYNWFTAVRSLSSTTATEFSSEIRITFISWLYDPVSMRANGGIYATTAGPGYAYIGMDTNSQSDSGGGCGLIGSQVPFSAQWDSGAAEGQSHFVTLYGIAASGGTITMTGNATQATGQRTNLTVVVMG